MLNCAVQPERFNWAAILKIFEVLRLKMSRWNMTCRQLKWLVLLLGWLFFNCPLLYAGNEIHFNASNDGNGIYAMKMLRLALSKIETKYNLFITDAEVSQGRNIQDVASGNLDLLWAATNQEMEDQLLPIRIPLYKGLLGHRIFIISPSSQYKFDAVKTFSDLQTIIFAQGTTWADTKILESNGLKVVHVNKYPSLFYMVDGGRFDAFPRGVQEPWSEMAKRPELSLAVEKHLMLVYRMPFYFFTNKKNITFAKDVELGLNRAIADGSFDRTFLEDPMVKDVLEKANLKNRLVFELKNPTLPKETPLDRPELWLDLKTL
jgi:hypothetical protein